jgi:tight adherence protein B
MDFLYIATAFAVFIAVALLVEGIYLLWNAKYGQQARRVAQRLRRVAQTSGAQNAALLTHGSQAPRSQQVAHLAGGVGRLLVQSGSSLTPARFYLASAGICVAATAALMLTGIPAFLAVGIAFGAGALPLLMALRRKARRRDRVVQQLPEALELISRALRAGHALPSAIKMAADEIPDPLGGEFLVLFNEITYGVPMQDALRNLALRMPGSDAGFFVVSALTQRETGGNLAELVDTSARIIRQRLSLLAQVKVFSAEGRLSAWILGLLPFGLGVVLHLVNPGFMAVLWADSTGLKMLGAVAVLMAAGVAWMRSVIRIRV